MSIFPRVDEFLKNGQLIASRAKNRPGRGKGLKSRKRGVVEMDESLKREVELLSRDEQLITGRVIKDTDQRYAATEVSSFAGADRSVHVYSNVKHHRVRQAWLELEDGRHYCVKSDGLQSIDFMEGHHLQVLESSDKRLGTLAITNLTTGQRWIRPKFCLGGIREVLQIAVIEAVGLFPFITPLLFLASIWDLIKVKTGAKWFLECFNTPSYIARIVAQALYFYLAWKAIMDPFASLSLEACVILYLPVIIFADISLFKAHNRAGDVINEYLDDARVEDKALTPQSAY